MTPRTLLSLLVLALFLPGCDLWNHGGDTDDPVLLPLDDGAVWVMAFTQTNAEGEVTRTLTDTLRVVGGLRVEGERWAEVACSEFRSIGCIPGGFYTNREDGVWKWAGPDSDEAPYLLYKYPARIGTTYELPGRTNFTVTVLGRNVPVETPAGTFRSYHYELDTDEANGYPIREGDGRLDRFLIPGQGFAFIGCSYLGSSDSGELVLRSRLEWRLISFDAP